MKLTNLRNIAVGALALTLSALSATATQWVDISNLRVINRYWTETVPTWGRLPGNLRTYFSGGADPTPTSAGVAVRFATNSHAISVKYTLFTNCHMNHQAPTGTKGADLYILDSNNEWRHMNCLRPADQKAQEGQLVAGLPGAMTEYMVYLPLYDGVTEMWIGLDDGATVTKGNCDAIDGSKRIVAFGTSILQGGCASRPGMVATSILSRRLNCEIINMGFSGYGYMTAKKAEILAGMQGIDAFILDPIPNSTDEMCRDLTYDFVKTIRDAHPGVPIFMVEGPMYPYARYTSEKDYLNLKNKYYHDAYLRLLEDNPADLYYIDNENLDGPEDDGTVEGIHLTDVGFLHYADKLEPYLREVISETKLMSITSHADGATNVPLAPTFVWSNPTRKGTLEISTSAAFASAGAVFSAEGTGSVDVPRYSLAASTTYYARVAYFSDPNNADNVSYTPTVSFTTESATPAIPAITYPTNGGTLHADGAFAFSPVDGAASLRLEVSAATTFAGRTSYVATIPTGVWKDSKTGSEIKLGTTALVDGKQYYARLRATFNNPDGTTTNTDWTEPILFTYSAQAGVDVLEADDLTEEEAVSYDVAGRRIEHPAPGIPVIRVATMTDGSHRITKTL